MAIVEFNPEPAGDYKTLLQQFKSLVRLHNANVNCLVLTRGEVAGLLSQLGRMSPGEVDSQRDANAELTTLLEQQEVKLSEKDKELARLIAVLGRTSRERDALREELLIKPGTGQTAYRAAGDIYYQLVEECGIPEGGSLVTYVDNLREAAHNVLAVFTGKRGDMTKQETMAALEIALDATNQEKPHG